MQLTDMFEKRTGFRIEPRMRRIRRAAHTVTGLFVLSYISFCVLDLDLSAFPSNDSATDSRVVLIETAETAEILSAMNAASDRFAASAPLPLIAESVRLQQINLRRYSRVREIRRRLRRLPPPRFSASDSSSAA